MDVDAIFWRLDLFASFLGQAKNEEPSRLEAKVKSYICISIPVVFHNKFSSDSNDKI
jgi:hypothetical protein